MRTMKTMMMSLFAAALFATGVAAGERLPVVAIADYCQTNGVVSVRRNMAEAILKAGCRRWRMRRRTSSFRSATP